MISQISTSCCKTVYDIDGIMVILFIITGGTPALSFDDHSFTIRFPKSEKWSDENWLRDELRYVHQDPADIKGPTYNVLPNGKQDILDFVKKHGRLKRIREARRLVIAAYDEMTSPFFTDAVTGDQCFVRFNFGPGAHLWPLKVSGRDKVLGPDLPREWEVLELVLSEMRSDTVDELSEVEYWEVIRCLERCAATARTWKTS